MPQNAWLHLLMVIIYLVSFMYNHLNNLCYQMLLWFKFNTIIKSNIEMSFTEFIHLFLYFTTHYIIFIIFNLIINFNQLMVQQLVIHQRLVLLHYSQQLKFLLMLSLLILVRLQLFLLVKLLWLQLVKLLIQLVKLVIQLVELILQLVKLPNSQLVMLPYFKLVMLLHLQEHLKLLVHQMFLMCQLIIMVMVQ